MSLRCQCVNTQEQVIRRSCIRKRGIQPTASTSIFAEYEQRTVSIPTTVPSFLAVEAECSGVPQMRDKSAHNGGFPASVCTLDGDYGAHFFPAAFAFRMA